LRELTGDGREMRGRGGQPPVAQGLALFVKLRGRHGVETVALGAREGASHRRDAREGQCVGRFEAIGVDLDQTGPTATHAAISEAR
jgi:hypothetical protein